MRRIFILLISLLLCLGIPMGASANSGPIYQRGYPSSDSYLVRMDSPIQVEKENLLFDFSENLFSHDDINCKVTAQYFMKNPTKSNQIAEMAFPFSGVVNKQDLDSIKISVNNKKIPFRIYSVGSVEDPYMNSEDPEVEYNLPSILKSITKKPLNLKDFRKQLDSGFYRKIIVLVYTVSFPPNSDVQLKVEYIAQGSMSKKETSTPQYKFTYFLSPAQYWSSFKNLTIEVKTSKYNPYILRSNIEFANTSPNVYNAAFATLPNNDLTFTIYENAKISDEEKFWGWWYSQFGYFYPIVIMFLIVSIFVVAIIVTVIVSGVRYKKRKIKRIF